MEKRFARDYVKSHGRTAKDVMTREVVSVTDTTELAMLLETKRIKRVPGLRDGKLVGIVSRANLVRALAVTSPRNRSVGFARVVRSTKSPPQAISKSRGITATAPLAAQPQFHATPPPRRQSIGLKLGRGLETATCLARN